MASQAELNTEAAAEYEMPRELWRHPDPKSTNMEVFRKQTNARHGVDLQVCGTPGVGEREKGADLGP